MAMKARGSGVWPVYEDFKPTSEWNQDSRSHNLVVYLPGFTKEQLRVSTEGRNIIRVRGERLIAGNTWSRFLEEFEVPENSDMNLVRAKFHEGALTITMPKKTVDKPRESSPRKEDSKGTSGHAVEKQGQDARSPTPFRDTRDAESKETSSSKEKLKGAEGEEDTLKATDMKEDKKLERSEDSGEDEMAGKIKPTTGTGDVATDETKEQGKGKQKRVIESSRADGEGFAKKAVKGFAQLSEERQLMVNMGAAVLVIVAFSAYVTYKFVSADDSS